MALLNHGSPQPTSAATPRRVTGQYLARAHLNRRQRARLAADLANGTAAIFPLTLRQAATLARVPVLDVSRTRRNGKPRVININGRSNGHEETLAAHMDRTTPAEWQLAARICGVDRIWDQMIAPIIAEERSA